MRQAFIAARLLTGAFTPFLVPYWDSAERLCVHRWIRDGELAGASSRLEEKFSNELGSDWSIRLTNSGRAALQLALEALQLPPESEVILPSFSCTGVCVPVLQAGLRPVLADVDEQFNISLESIQEAFSPTVRAVIVPHLSGCWARDTARIVEWARKQGVFVVEDCAQSYGLRYNGKLAGTYGDVAVYSSGMGKLLFGPGGGWAITRNPEIARGLRTRKLEIEARDRVAKRVGAFVRDYAASEGSRGRSLLKEIIGHRLRHPSVRPEPCAEPPRFPLFAMSEIEAELALLQVQKTKTAIELRQANATRWRQLVSRAATGAVHFPPEVDNISTKMLVSFRGERAVDISQKMRRSLWEHGIETEASYTPLHLRPPFQSLRRTAMPVTEAQWRGAFSLPVRPNLTSKDWDRIGRAVDAWASTYEVGTG